MGFYFSLRGNNMRMNNIPRALKQGNSIVEQIELGPGMSDRRTKHISEQNWFDNLKNTNIDPRYARSDYHDPANIMVDRKTKTEIKEIELAEGYIEDVIMYLDGAHIKIIDENDIYFIFAPDINFIVKGTKIKVIDKIIKTIFPYETYPGSGEFAFEEKRSLIITECEQNNETETEE